MKGFHMVTTDQILEGKKNFKKIKHMFTAVSVEVDDGVIHRHDEVRSWIEENCCSMVLTQQQWSYLDNLRDLNPYEHTPTMEEILRSIRMIIAQENDSRILENYYFLDKEEALHFKLVF